MLLIDDACNGHLRLFVFDVVTVAWLEGLELGTFVADNTVVSFE